MRILRKGAGDQVAGKDNQWWQTDRREETTSRSSSTDDGYNTSPDDTPYIGPNQDGGDGDDSSDSSKRPPKKDKDQDDEDNEKDNNDNNDDNDNNEQNEDNDGDDTGNPNDDYDTDPDSDNDSPYDTSPDDDTDESDDSGDSDSTDDSSGNEGDGSGVVAAGEDGEGDNSTGEDDPGELGAEGTDAYSDDGAQTPPPTGYDGDDGPDVNAAMDGEAPEGEMGEDGLDGYNDDASNDNDSEEGESPSVDEAMDNESPEGEMGEDGTESYDDEGNEGDGDDEGGSEDSSGSDSDSSDDTGSEVGGAGLSGESADSDMPTAGATPGVGMDTEELGEGLDTDQLESPDEGLDGISADTGGSSEVGETVGDGADGVAGEEMALLNLAQDLDGAVDEDGNVDDEAVSEASKKAAKSYIKSIIIANLGYILLAFFVIAMVVGAMGTYLTLNSANVVIMEEEAGGGSDGKGVGDLDYSNHNLSDGALEWKDEVEEALSKTGLGEEWVYVVLGMIHQESGGNAEASPDIMQSSESKGWEPNTITDPIVSIEAGVEALEKAVNAAEAQGISDLRAILQGYNMGHKFLTIMSEEGQTHWTSDYAEQYSINVVFPAVTNRPASEAARADSYSAWSIKIGKPYYIKNGGDFHYPNAILHALGIDYTGDGPIDIADVKTAILVEGSLKGYQFPMPIDEMQITSDFGMRLSPTYGTWMPHNGIDAQYKGALFHGEGPIYSAADGRVTFAGDLGTAGNAVIILHGPPGKNDIGLDPDHPITTKYYHLAMPSSLRVGQEIKAGEYIGREGKTGLVTGEHLHYELHGADGAFNPRLIHELPISLY